MFRTIAMTFILCMGFLLIPFDSPSSAMQIGLGDCPNNATSLRSTAQAYTCRCSAMATASGSVWGTDEYSDDSRICRAALHAGVTTRNGGTVTFEITPGRDGYEPTYRNGVQSARWGRWSGSYRFLGGRYSRDPSARAEQCPGNATGLRGGRDAYSCYCLAANTRTGNVWGTMVYTDDSRICRAALHAGVIGPDGGTVTIRPSAGRRSYDGSRRNGVTTSDYGRWQGSFRFEY